MKGINSYILNKISFNGQRKSCLKKNRKCIPGIQVTFFVPLQQLLCFCFLCVGKIIYPTIKLNWKRNRNYRRIPGEKHRYNGIENVNKCKIEVNALK